MIKCIDHSGGPKELGAVTMAVNADMIGVIHVLRDIAKALAITAEQEAPVINVPALPLPTFVNEIEVCPTPIEFHAAKVENRIEVLPTPIEHAVHFDLNRLVLSIYVFAGVLGVCALGIILTAVLLAR